MEADMKQKNGNNDNKRACPACEPGKEESRQIVTDSAQNESDLLGSQLSSAIEEEKIALDEERKTAECAGHRHKKRTPEEQKALITRLKRVEGQIRGIEKMVENDAYCPDILIQVSAATSALNSFNKQLLQCHIRGCVAPDIRDGKEETIDELCNVLQKLMR